MPSTLFTKRPAPLITYHKNMFRVAVVEDDQNFATRMKNYLRRYASTQHLAFSYDFYSDGLSFLDEFAGQYQLVFMDIIMPGANGLETAAKMRQKDQDLCLIFITTQPQYALHGYEVSAFDFIVKPLHYNLFEIKMNKAMRSIHPDESIVINQPGDDFRRLSIRDIFYVESQKHYLIFHTSQGEYRMRGRMSDVNERLLVQGFVNIRKSILVNMAYITRVDNDTVGLDGTCLPVAHSHKQEFRQQLAVYLAGKA